MIWYAITIVITEIVIDSITVFINEITISRTRSQAFSRNILGRHSQQTDDHKDQDKEHRFFYHFNLRAKCRI